MRKFLRAVFVAWWKDPVTVKVTVTRSPDWEGDAAEHRRVAGWDKW